jgi:hypothetical protein
MAKVRKRKPRPRRMTLEQFDSDHKRVIALARKPGGLLVVDSEGNVRFRLTIPCYAIPAG